VSGTTPLTITVRPELTRTLAKLTAMRPHERAVAAGRIREELQAARVACTMVRREAVWDLRDEGCTWQQIADLLGMRPTFSGCGTSRRPSGRRHRRIEPGWYLI